MEETVKIHPEKSQEKRRRKLRPHPLGPRVHENTLCQKTGGEKKKCKLCGREVAHMHMERHFTTRVCQTANRLKELETKLLAVRGIDIFEGKQVVAFN